MEEELAILVLSYAKRNKKVDKLFISEAINIMVRYFSLDDFVLQLKWIVFKRSFASYNFVYKRVNVNYRILKKYANDFAEYEYPVSSLWPYIFIIKVLCHEVCGHAKQHRQILCDDSLESMILSEEDSVSTKIIENIKGDYIKLSVGIERALGYRKKYYDLYEYSPMERMAEIDATDIVCNVALALSDELSVLHMQIMNFGAYLSGYNVGDISSLSDEPTKYYLDSMNDYSMDLQFNDRWLDIVKRSYGISQQECSRLGLRCDQDYLGEIASEYNGLIRKLEKRGKTFYM